MSKQIEALKLALEGLEKWHFDKDPRGAADYIAAIHDALAEQPAQQQEPAAWMHTEDYKTHFTTIPSPDMIENGYWQPLYTSPQPAQQEPVAWRWTESNGRHWFDWRTDWTHHDRAKAMGFAIEYAYSSPQPSKPWVGLTDKETGHWSADFLAGAKWAEAKLREKNT